MFFFMSDFEFEREQGNVYVVVLKVDVFIWEF